jgi:hypothetical protein
MSGVVFVALELLWLGKQHVTGRTGGQWLRCAESSLDCQLAKNPYYTQYQKAPTFAVGCEWFEHHTYRKGAPL